MIDKKKIALIHVAKNQLNLTEDTYRTILKSLGVESSKELTDEGFKRIMDIFRHLGFVSNASIEEVHIENEIWSCTDKERRYIEVLWIRHARNKTSDALHRFIYRIVKKPVFLLTKKDVEKIINAIKHLKTGGGNVRRVIS